MPEQTPITSNSPQPILYITPEIKGYLNTTASWAKFIAILGLVFLGIGFLANAYIFFSTMFSVPAASFPDSELNFSLLFTGAAALQLIFILLVTIPLVYLYRFADGIHSALHQNSQALLTSAFQSLKSHYKYYGTLILVFLSIYAIILVCFFSLPLSFT